MAPSVHPLRAADIRQRNEKIVLRLIHSARGRGLSQSEVVLATGLKPPTIFRIFSSLEEMGYIEPLERGVAGARPDRKGRRPLAYVARRGALYVIGVEFWYERISLGVFDFQGASVYSKMINLSRTEDAEAVVGRIASLVEEAIATLGIERDRVLGVGIGAPGEVNVGRREVIAYQRIRGMKNFPIADLLEKKLGLEIFVHNNCSVVAKSEFRYGGLGDEDSLFMFLLRSGLNGAFVDRGKVFLSPQGTTIEMGHICIDYNGPVCECGSKGCLEAFISALNKENLEAGRWLFQSEPGKDEGWKLELASDYLASAVHTLLRLFKPSSFLFVSCSEQISAALAEGVQKRLSANPSSFDEVQPRFIGRSYDPSLAWRGAADLVIDSFLE